MLIQTFSNQPSIIFFLLRSLFHFIPIDCLRIHTHSIYLYLLFQIVFNFCHTFRLFSPNNSADDLELANPMDVFWTQFDGFALIKAVYHRINTENIENNQFDSISFAKCVVFSTSNISNNAFWARTQNHNSLVDV